MPLSNSFWTFVSHSSRLSYGYFAYLPGMPRLESPHLEPMCSQVTGFFCLHDASGALVPADFYSGVSPCKCDQVIVLKESRRQFSGGGEPLTGIILFLSMGLITVQSTFAASPYSGNTSRAVQWLSQHQNIDGSWGASDDVKLPYTAEAVTALRALNQFVPSYYWGITWLENHNAPNVIGKRPFFRRTFCAGKRGSSGFPVGDGVKIEAAETEPDHDFEAFGISVTACCILDRLNTGVDSFTKSIRDSMGEVVEDLCQTAFQIGLFTQN